MSRLIDQLRAGGKVEMPNWVVKVDEWDGLARHVYRLLLDPQLPVLVIDNVADYYYTGTGQEDWDLTQHFPNLAPPYPAWWAEHHLPSRIHSDRVGDTDTTQWTRNGRIGVLTHALDPAKCQGMNLPECKWILWCELFIDYGIRVAWKGRQDRDIIATGPCGSMFLCIDDHGALIERPWMQSLASNADADLMKKVMVWLYPMLLAVSFLHCKNVKVDDNRMPVALAKRWRERHGQSPVAWKTLVIEPLKQILRTEGRSGEVGAAKAMHICRGHFADYREGRGLFGKYHQLVWIPAIVRGTKGKSAPAREMEIKV